MAEIKEVDLIIQLLDGTWRSLDLDTKTTFSINYQASDITDPTATRIPFSQQITLPKTRDNEDIFNNIWKYEGRLININAIDRTNFMLYVQGTLFQQGYLKLELASINSYRIRLYGGLGDYFYVMSDTSYESDEDMYLKNLKFGTQFNHTINRNYVYNNWRLASLPASGINSYFGYAMTYQGQYDNFDSKTVVSGANPDTDVEDVKWQSISDNKQKEPQDLTENGRQFLIGNQVYAGQYMSYYQRPMIRVQKIFNGIIDRMAELGWKTNLDPTFFNPSNPYWNDLWCILPNYSTDGAPSGTEIPFTDNLFSGSGVSGNFNRAGAGDQIGSGGRDDHSATGRVRTFGQDGCRTVCNIGPSSENTNLQGGSSLVAVTDNLSVTYTITFNDVNVDPTKDCNITFYIPYYLRWVGTPGNNDRRWKSQNTNGNSANNTMYISSTAQLGSRSESLNANGQNGVTTFNYNNQTCRPMNRMNNHSWYNHTSDVGGEYDTSAANEYIFQKTINFPAGTFNANSKPSVSFTIRGDDRWFGYGSKGYTRGMSPIIRLTKDGYISYSQSAGSGTRSNSDITYTDIVQSQDTCSDFLLSYCKTFGMYFVKDTASNTVDILTRNSYYGKQEKEDWTNKIDYNREITEDIANFDYKIGVLKWRDTDSKYETEYYGKYSKEYGSLRLNTNYAFSDAEKDYFSNNIFSNCIVATGFSDYYLGRTTTLYKDNKTLPYLEDKDAGGLSDTFTLVYRRFPASVANRPFTIADDNDYMLTYGYSWPGDAGSNQSATMYPDLTRTITKGGNNYSLMFGTPAFNYGDNDTDGEGQTSTTSDGGTIYNRFWQNYLRDRLSKDAKVLTCYVNLTISDIQDVNNLLRKFIFINNTCWVINKIHGFNPLNSEPTKVELIRVESIANYVSQDYIAGSFNIRYPAGGQYIYESETSTSQPSVRLTSDAQPASFTFELSPELAVAGAGWTIIDTGGLTVTPTSSTSASQTVNVQVPANTTGTAVYWTILIRWGNSITALTIVQVSNWNVSVSAQNGTANASGGGESGTSIDVADGTSVTLTTTGNSGYIFGYWDINGTTYYDQTVTLAVTDNIVAQAVWVDASSFGWEYDILSVGYEGGTLTNNLSTSYGVSYSIASSPSVDIEPNSGFASSDVTFVIPENNNPTQITYTVTATYDNGLTAQFTIVQDAIDYINIDPDTADIDSNSNEITVVVDSNSSWTVTDPSGELDLSTVSGTGDGQVIVTVPANESTEERTYEVIFATENDTKTLTITQAAFEPSISIDPETIVINGTQNNYVIAVTSNTDWTIYVDPIYDPYFNVTPLSGTGNGQVTVRVSPNGSTQSRVGEAVFSTTTGTASVTHIATQTAGVSGAYVNLTNQTGSVIQLSSDLEISLINSNNSVVDQYTVTSIPTGSTRYEFDGLPIGDYTVRLSDYTGTTTANAVWNTLPGTDQTVEVVGGNIDGVTYGFQVAQARTLVLTPDTVTVGSILNNFTLNLICNSTLSWSISDNATWISCSPTTGTGSATINVTVAANLLGNRQAVITATSTNGTPVLTDTCNVSQTGILRSEGEWTILTEEQEEE